MSAEDAARHTIFDLPETARKARQSPRLGIAMTDVCALCLQNATLCNSHIVPEFCYQSIYDEKHRMIAFSPNNSQNRKFEQKGLRSYLLCADCESLISTKLESPFKEFWVDGKQLEGLISSRPLLLRNIDYQMFKLFHLSVLWRASVTYNAAFNEVSLGNHAEIIRRMLLAGDPGPEQRYPIFCRALIKSDGSPCSELFMSPRRFKLGSHHGYTLTYCGCEWGFIISSHRCTEVERRCLSENGTLPIANEAVESLFKRIQRQVGY